MTNTCEKYGRAFEQHPDGGWVERGAVFPPESKARICGGYVFSEAATKMHGGVFMGGVFLGGEFRGGVFLDGEFRGGVFLGGEFLGGEFRGGVFLDGEFRGGVFLDGEFRGGVFLGGLFRGGEFRGGVFLGGEFWGGTFRGGEFWGGLFRGGEFHKSPSMAQRSDGFCFISKYVNDDLRIWAGCRDFSWDEAIQHWDDSHENGAETQRILHFLKAQEDAARITKHEEEQKT